MNMVSKLIVLILWTCLFSTVHAQTTNGTVETPPSEEEIIQHHVNEVNRLRAEMFKNLNTDEAQAKKMIEEASPGVRIRAINTRNTIKEEIKIRNPNFSEEELNQETNRETQALFARNEAAKKNVGVQSVIKDRAIAQGASPNSVL